MKYMDPIDWMILIIVAVAVIPDALDSVFAVDTSGWGVAGTLWDVAPILIVAGGFYYFRRRGSQKN